MFLDCRIKTCPIGHQKSNNNCTATFYLKDCITGLKENVKDKSADVVVTSPPITSASAIAHKDELPREKYLTWMEEVGIAVTALTDDGSFFLNIGNKPKDPWIAWDVAYVLRKLLYSAKCHPLGQIDSNKQG